MARARWSWLAALGAVAALAACASGCGGGGGSKDDAGVDGGNVCSTDQDCDDGLFCNGTESCMPASIEADRQGCVHTGDPCLDGQSCDDDEDRCITDCATVEDADGDGHDSTDCGGDDCDDSDPRSYPGNTEVCDDSHRDEDCDPTTFGAKDEDGDEAISDECCNVASDGSLNCGTDCNDLTIAQRPDQLEICDSADNDCDGDVDEEMNEVPWYPDDDGDGFGQSDSSMRSCVPITGASLLGTDCDDTSSASSPAGIEMCDGVDNDCDGQLDEGMPTVDWYPDADGDGFGDRDATADEIITSCAPIAGHSMIGTDCDDGDIKINPLVDEICDGIDHDCDGMPDDGGDCVSPMTMAPSHDWSTGLGGIDADTARNVAIDAAGNVYVAGSFEGTASFGGASRTAEGLDIFVASFGPDGSHRWSFDWGAAVADEARDIDVTEGGDVYVTGAYRQTVDFGGPTRTEAGLGDVFLAKLDTDGATTWVNDFGSASRDAGTDIAIGPSGAVLLTGHFQDTVDPGGGSLTSDGGTDVFLVKYNDDGSHDGSERYGGLGFDGDCSPTCSSVDVDGDGAVYLATAFEDSVSFGGDTFTSDGAKDIALVKLDASGAHDWSIQLGGPTGEQLEAVTVAGPNVCITGGFSDTVDWGDGDETTTGADDIFIACYDRGDGSHVWSETYGSADPDAGRDIVAGPGGSVIVTGAYSGPVDFGGGERTPAAVLDVFVVALSASDGSYLWDKVWGGGGGNIGFGSAVGPSNELVVTGELANPLDFGGGVVEVLGATDVFLVKLD